jgi:hypothetical protein
MFIEFILYFLGQFSYYCIQWRRQQHILFNKLYSLYIKRVLCHAQLYILYKELAIISEIGESIAVPVFAYIYFIGNGFNWGYTVVTVFVRLMLSTLFYSIYCLATSMVCCIGRYILCLVSWIYFKFARFSDTYIEPLVLYSSYLVLFLPQY